MDCASHFEACGASCGDMRRAARRLLNRDCSMSAAAMITLSSSMSARCLSGCCPGDRSRYGFGKGPCQPTVESTVLGRRRNTQVGGADREVRSEEHTSELQSRQ